MILNQSITIFFFQVGRVLDCQLSRCVGVSCSVVVRGCTAIVCTAAGAVIALNWENNTLSSLPVFFFFISLFLLLFFSFLILSNISEFQHEKL